MLRQTLNELRVRLEIRPASPLLVKEGRPDTDQKDLMAFVYSQPTRGRKQYYIPGSSLRGVLRSTAERLIGRWRPDLVTDPFAPRGNPFAGTDRTLQYGDATASTPKASSVEIYGQALPVERCFGHTALRGRWVAGDAWLQETERHKLVVRDGVGINRETGAAQEGIKFRYETITRGVFTTELTIVNYELWQLGLLAHLLAALDSGDMRVGYGTRRGLGQINVQVSELAWRWYQSKLPPRAENGVVIPTLARLARDAELKDDYKWGDAYERPALILPLQRRQEAHELVPRWIWPFTAGQAMQWNADPWPMLGNLLPEAITHWPRRQQPEEQHA